MSSLSMDHYPQLGGCPQVDLVLVGQYACRSVTLRDMNRTLARLLAEHQGVVRRAEVLAHVDHTVLDQALRSGRLIRAYPSVYLDRALAGDRDAAIRGALAYAGGPGGPGGQAALSHVTALHAWRLPVPQGGPVHITVAASRRLRGTPGVLVHRRAGFAAEPPHAVIRDGLPVTMLERSLVDSWPLLDGDAARAPFIRAVAERLTTPGRLREAMPDQPVRRRRELCSLIDLLAAGCHSELELWGHRHIFSGSEMPPFRWQVPVPLANRTIYLDVFDDETRTNFELDGTKYHAGPRDRERDLRRDALLATRGILVVRFGHDRLVHQPAQVRREVLDILCIRRATTLRTVG
jgi:very-short-patch-repair endonuclease